MTPLSVPSGSPQLESITFQYEAQTDKLVQSALLSHCKFSVQSELLNTWFFLTWILLNTYPQTHVLPSQCLCVAGTHELCFSCHYRAAGAPAPSSPKITVIIENREATLTNDPEESKCVFKVTKDPGVTTLLQTLYQPFLFFSLFSTLKIKRKPSTTHCKDTSQAPTL
jgi:hypothetical protein